MTTARDLTDAIGRTTLADTVGVGLTAVSNAVVRGYFPSSWFVAVKSLADAQGVACPPKLFKMRPITSPDVNAFPARQPRPGKPASKGRASA